jgi:hypothetical protein
MGIHHWQYLRHSQGLSEQESIKHRRLWLQDNERWLKRLIVVKLWGNCRGLKGLKELW